MTVAFNNVAFGPIVTPAFNFTGDALQTTQALAGLGRDLSSWTLRVANLLNLVVPGAALPIPVSAGGTGLVTFTPNVVYKGAGASPLAPSAITETGTQTTISYNAGTPPAGTNTPSLQIIDANSSVNVVELSVAASSNQLVGFRSEGTVASPTQTSAGVAMLRLASQAYDNSPARTTSNATLSLNTANAPTSTDHSSNITLAVTPKASVTLGTVATFNAATDGGTQLVGTTSGDNAASGIVGEYLSAIVLIASEVNINAAANVVTLSVTAGDWDVSGELWVDASTGGASLTGNVRAAITLATGTEPSVPSDSTARAKPSAAPATVPAGSTVEEIISVGPVRVSVSSSTNVFLVGFASVTAGTAFGYGKLMARRVR